MDFEDIGVFSAIALLFGGAFMFLYRMINKKADSVEVERSIGTTLTVITTKMDMHTSILQNKIDNLQDAMGSMKVAHERCSVNTVTAIDKNRREVDAELIQIRKDMLGK